MQWIKVQALGVNPASAIAKCVQQPPTLTAQWPTTAEVYFLLARCVRLGVGHSSARVQTMLKAASFWV